MSRPICTLLVSWLACSATLAATDPTARVGQVLRLDPQAGELRSSQPEVVLGGQVLLSLDEASIVRLDNGEVLRLDPNSSAILRPADSGGRVEVTVLSGRVYALGSSGRWLTAGSGSRFLVRPRGDDPSEVEQVLLGAVPERVRHDEPRVPGATTKRLRRQSD